MDLGMMISYFFLPMRWIMRQTHAEGVFSNTFHCLVKIPDLDEATPPVLHTDQRDLLTAFFQHHIFIQQQPVAQLRMLPFYFFQVLGFFGFAAPFDIVSIVMVAQNRILTIRSLQCTK